MAEQGNWTSVLRGVIQRMVATDVTELELRQGDLRLRLRRSAQPSSPPSSANAPASETQNADREGLHRISAPLTGVFYTAPNPASKPYIAEGDWVEQDSVVGLIETMKVFNEVVADCRGRVASILARQGQLVHAGDPLMLVDLAATPDDAGEVRP